MKNKNNEIITRTSKLYPLKFYISIMDESYIPINKIWVNERLGKLGTYGEILNGKQDRKSYKEWLRKNERRKDFYFY
tara:strand:- start:4 stop:234 length:231 start_codon:yes stop_codon:yes gene_type:complete